MRKSVVKLPIFLCIFALSAIVYCAIVDAAEQYNRKEFGGWIDADKDCQDTRQEVLIRQSAIPVTFDEKGCKVLAGEWHCPFTGRTFFDPRKLDIDHLVPLKEAFVSGGKYWEREQKREYANDLSHPYALIAVAAGANRSKGSRDPANWMPPNTDFHVEYIRRWLDVKRANGLNFDSEEVIFLVGHFIGDNQ